jgi:4-hydroxy 2-oxovalerate aldolase
MLKLLDCTFRDGGYYNNWDFDFDLVNKYLLAMSKAKIDIVEIGFRSINSIGYRGPFYYSPDFLLQELNIPSDLKIAVMVNAKEYIHQDKVNYSLLEKYFPNTNVNSKFDIIRIASHIEEISNSIEIVSFFKNKGYEVGLNLMQISEYSMEKISSVCRELPEKLDVFYFADSLGSLNPERVKDIMQTIKDNWIGEIGIHAHNNKELAFVNSLTAYENGAQWIDGTVTGMGRGPGNTCTETLLVHFLNQRKLSIIELTDLWEIISNYFIPLKTKHKWGSNLLYAFAGESGIHPTYVQTIIEDKSYNHSRQTRILANLGLSEKAARFKGTVKSVKSFDRSKNQPFLNGTKAIIIGKGSSVTKNKFAIERFIDTFENLNILKLNFNNTLNLKKSHFTIISNKVTITDIQNSNIPRNNKETIVTNSRKLHDEFDKLKTHQVLFQEIHGDEIFINSISNNNLTSLDTLAFCLELCIQNQVSEIYFVGLDGYENDVLKTQYMNKILSIFKLTHPNVILKSLTPTMYSIEQQSLYESN